MSITTVTLTGFVATEPKLWFTKESRTAVVNLRVGTTPRRVDANGEWHDGTSSFFTVNCWRRLALNVHGSLRKGSPVIIRGRLRTRSWDDNGKVRTLVEIEADSIGHDLSFGWSTFVKGLAPGYEKYLDPEQVAGGAGDGFGAAPAAEDGGFAEPSPGHAGLAVMDPDGAELADGPGPSAEGAEGSVGAPEGELAAEGVPF